MVFSQVLQQGVDGGDGDDHAITGYGEQQSGKIEVAREGESDDGGVESGGSADDKQPAAAKMRERRDGDGAEECARAGTSHQDAEAGFVAGEDVASEVRNKGEIWNGQQAAYRDQQHQRRHG